MYRYQPLTYALPMTRPEIPRHTCPAKLTDEGWEDFQSAYTSELHLIAFWKKMKLSYAHFEADSTIANVSVVSTGEYQFNQLAH